MATPAALPPPALYAAALAWLPAVCRAKGIDPATITDDLLPYLEVGIRAGLAAAGAAALRENAELREIRAGIERARADLALVPCAVAE